MKSAIKSFSILLVEDDLTDSMLFTELLNEVAPDIHLDHVENGLEALSFLDKKGNYNKSQRPDLIILDLNMPIMNGFDFLEKVKQSKEHKNIPVLVLSTSEHDGDVRKVYTSQAAGYVVKPRSYTEYTQMLDSIQAYWRHIIRLPRTQRVSS